MIILLLPSCVLPA